ncbi:MAG TPA: SPOR domain-containing protein [Gemmatimonadales bacterium]|jgi:hypothetical protein
MQARLTIPVVALAAALAGCGGQPVPASSHHLPASVASPPSDAALLRVSRTGGTAQLVQANSLVPREWIINGGLPAIGRLVAASSEDHIVYAVDNTGKLVAIDVLARRWRVVPIPARDFVGAPDGTIIGVDSARHPVRFVARTMTVDKGTVERGASIVRGPGEEVLAIGGHPPMLTVIDPKGEVRRIAVPEGRAAATWLGDLVAVATDSGIVLVDPAGKQSPRFVRVRGGAIVATFSPSGHRLYVARKKGGLVMIDRFTHAQLGELPAPGPARSLRVDRSGRWLIADAATGERVWVIDLASWSVATTIDAPWGDDLPQVVDGHTLLFRQRTDLVAVDLLAGPQGQRGVLVGGAAELYLMLPWVPKIAPVTVATEPSPATSTDSSTSAGEPATPRTAARPTAVPAKPATVAGTIYLQVSSSQNKDWADAFAKQLKDAGFPAKVLDPKTADEGYRVVVGPYPTRESADSVGKRLGRSYFILTPGSGDG